AVSSVSNDLRRQPSPRHVPILDRHSVDRQILQPLMKLGRTKEYNFGWLVLFALVDVAFLLIFFLLLSSNFILQPGISVSMPFSRFTLGPQDRKSTRLNSSHVEISYAVFCF